MKSQVLYFYNLVIPLISIDPNFSLMKARLFD